MTDKNLFVNFTLFIRKFIVFIVAPAGYIRNVGFLLLKIVIFIIVAAVTQKVLFQMVKFATKIIKTII